MTVIPLHEPRRHIGRVRHHTLRRTLTDATDGVLATLREWRRRARDRAQLARLDDRMLKDIGLTRADAQFLSDKPFWRE
jgi:uncharacterized protein YjiS (DUF1127 family)